jgi:hypothetical protein
VGELDGLFGRLLRLSYTVDGTAKNNQQCDEHTYPPKRLIQRIEHLFDHGCS